jgi:hypothetical protein
MANRHIPLTLAAFALAALISLPAMACPSDSYDREGELAAIKQALPGANVAAKDKTELERVVRVATVNSENLTLKGIAMQSDARGKAMELLGIARIPSKPQEELKAIDAKLQAASTLSDSEEQAKRLRDEAEQLWSAGQYDAARESLGKALNLLQINLLQFRC